LTSNSTISVPEMNVSTTLNAWLTANSNITLDRE
jgi:hypothetical protein